MANELQVEALIINGAAANEEITAEFLESELKDLEVPYFYNNGALKSIDEEKFSILCVTTEMLQRETEALDGYLSTEKPMIMVTDNRILVNEANAEYMKLVLADESPVIQIISVNNGRYKEMLNDRVLFYGALEVNVDPEQGFVTLLRLKGLEAE